MSMPVVRMAKFTGFAPSSCRNASQRRSASGTAPLTNTTNLAKRMSFMAARLGSEVRAQVHAGIEPGDLLGVAVEHQRRAPAGLADALLGGLAPARMVHLRVDVGVEAVLVRGACGSTSSAAGSRPA